MHRCAKASPSLADAMELYHLPTDPFEADNVADGHAEVKKIRDAERRGLSCAATNAECAVEAPCPTACNVLCGDHLTV